MSKQTSKPKLQVSLPRLTQPEEMKTRAYVYGVEKLNGYDAWALFKACGLGDTPKVKVRRNGADARPERRLSEGARFDSQIARSAPVRTRGQ